MEDRQVARYAEWICSPAFVAAKNDTWKHDPDPEKFQEIYESATGIMLDAFSNPSGAHVSTGFEIRRNAALRSIKDNAFGESPFSEYMEMFEGSGAAQERSVDELGMGEREPILRSLLMSLRNTAPRSRLSWKHMNKYS